MDQALLGISAAVYLKRANVDAIIISNDGGTLQRKYTLENYYPFQKIQSTEIYDMGINQAKSLDIPMYTAEIVNIEMNAENNIYILSDSQNNKYMARYIFLGIGADKKTYTFKGFKDFEGKGISYCTICDAFFYKNKDVAVIRQYKIYNKRNRKFKKYSK